MYLLGTRTPTVLVIGDEPWMCEGREMVQVIMDLPTGSSTCILKDEPTPSCSRGSFPESSRQAGGSITTVQVQVQVHILSSTAEIYSTPMAWAPMSAASRRLRSTRCRKIACLITTCSLARKAKPCSALKHVPARAVSSSWAIRPTAPIQPLLDTPYWR